MSALVEEYQDWATDDRAVWLAQAQARSCPLRAFSTLKSWRYLAALLLAGYASFTIGYVPDPLPEPRTPVTVAPVAGTAILDSVQAALLMDADILAGVAKAEDPRAFAAVQWVMLNRAGCEFLEGSLYACQRPLVTVATEGQAFGTVIDGVYHRSWWPGRTWKAAADRVQLAEAEDTAERVLTGQVPDPTGGATHYHRVGTWTPPWAPGPRSWRILGSHAFYHEVFPQRGL